MNKKEIEKREGSLPIRAFIVYACVVLASIGVFYRVIDLQFFKQADLKEKSEATQKTIRQVPLLVERGTIFTCNGDVLVQRVTKYRIAIDTYPTEIIKREGMPDSIKVLLPDKDFNDLVGLLADSIAGLFGGTSKSWEQKLREARYGGKPNRDFLICDDAGISEYNRVKTFPILCKYNALCKPKPKSGQPRYPYGDLARRTLGHVEWKNTELASKVDPVGIEGEFDKELSGTPGRISRRLISNISIDVKDDKYIEPRDGFNIATTLDMTIQDIANSALENSIRKFNADAGCVIVMEVATGNVLAMVNLTKGSSGICSDKDSRNIALDKYEPGSTFKTASLLVALNDGKVTPNTKKSVSAVEQIGHKKVSEDHFIEAKEYELWNIFAQSSNVGTVKTIYDNYASNPQQFLDGLAKLGFNDEPLRFPVYGGDRVSEVKKMSSKGQKGGWSNQSMSSIPMGYEVEVTPLHLLMFYNAIANNGCMVAPRLVTKLFSKDSTILKNVDTLNIQICSPQALRYIQSMLDSVVTCGTGRKGFMGAPYKVAGKTGTAQDHAHTKVQGKKFYNASFCGYFPADNPKYSCIVVLKTGAKDIYGGTIALPVFRDIADKIYAMDYDLMPKATALSKDADLASIPIATKTRSTTLKAIFDGTNFNATVPMTSEWLKTYSDGNRLHIENAAFSRDGLLPDVKGMSLTDAVYILEKAGMATEIKGFGRVKKQTPEANVPLPRNKKVILELDIEG